MALQATEEDVEQCVARLESAPAREQALLLTVVYVYAFPWPTDDLSKESHAIQRGRNDYWSPLAVNLPYFDTQNRKSYQGDRERFRKIIERYTASDAVAFRAILDRRRQWSALEARKKFLDSWNFHQRGSFFSHEDFARLKEQHPTEYPKWISFQLGSRIYDALSLSVVSGICKDYLNTSKTAKTVGQIATQLLESWEPIELNEDGEPVELDEKGKLIKQQTAEEKNDADVMTPPAAK
ncbi:MAG: hypothetical protein Q4D38_09950 [Planctomycetia bacterium]|nr:hypothetical protein [Planctomycetia bacterium]